MVNDSSGLIRQSSYESRPMSIKDHIRRYSFGAEFQTDSLQHQDFRDNWYALFVATGEEDKVKERLRYKFKNSADIRLLVPKRKLRERKNGVWETKIRTLFPGYIMVNGPLGIEEYYTLKGTPGLIRILKDKSGLLEIHKNEIKVINSLIYEDEIIGTSNVVMEGTRIIVVEGPLLGMDGLIQSVDRRKGRAKVRLNFIGEPRLVDLSISLVQPA